jgi:hypothetical protein
VFVVVLFLVDGMCLENHVADLAYALAPVMRRRSQKLQLSPLMAYSLAKNMRYGLSKGQQTPIPARAVVLKGPQEAYAKSSYAIWSWSRCPDALN